MFCAGKLGIGGVDSCQGKGFYEEEGEEEEEKKEKEVVEEGQEEEGEGEK